MNERRGLPHRYYVAVAAALALAGLAIVLITFRQEGDRRRREYALRQPLRDGNYTLIIDETGRLTGLPIADRELQREVTDALRSGVLSPMSGMRSARLNKSAPIQLISPAGGMVLSQRPDFRWRAAAGAISFEVEVFDASSKRVLSSGPLRAPEWSASGALAAGQTYSWTVTGHYDFKNITTPQTPEPQAHFRIAPPEVRREMEAARAQQSNVIDLVTAHRLGLNDEAIGALNRLEASNPGSPLIAHLRASLMLR